MLNPKNVLPFSFALCAAIGCDPSPDSESDTGAGTGSSDGDDGSESDGSDSDGSGDDGSGDDGSDDETTGDSAGLDCLDEEPLPATVEGELVVGPGCVVMGQTKLASDAHIEFVAGTTVLVLPDGFLDAGGGFGTTARMTATETTFTSAAAEPMPGDWGCIALGSGSSLSSVTIEFGGAPCGVNGLALETGLYIDGPNPHVTAAVLDSAGHGLVMGRFAEITGDEESAFHFNGNALASVSTSPQAVMDVGPSVFEDPDDYILVGGPSTGHIDGQGTLHYQTAPYVVDGQLNIGGGGTPDVHVTIDAGVQIQMLGGSIEIRSNATVNMMGAGNDPIIITSAAQSPAPGDWGCIYAPFAGPFSMQHVIVEYAGSGEGCHGSQIEAALAEVPEGSMIIDTTIQHSAGAGISGQFGVCDGAWCTNEFLDNDGVDIACPGSDPASLAC